jgi:putative alpha-1,2-mannosidase
VLSSPCFQNTTLGAGTPGALNIVAHNFTPANIYIARATLDGSDLASPFANHSDLFRGGAVLEYWLDDHPHVWGGDRIP